MATSRGSRLSELILVTAAEPEGDLRDIASLWALAASRRREL